MEKLPNKSPDDNSGLPGSIPLESLRYIFRGQSIIHAAQIDQEIPLRPGSLLRTSWLALELAARLEGRA